MRLASLSIVLALLPVPALAEGFTDLAALDRSVSAFTGAAIGEPGGATQPVDRRMRLAACAAPPVLSWYGTGRDTVMVRCPDPGSWRIFVPLTQGAQTTSQPAVLRGEAVTISIEGEGFSIAQAGEAMDQGAVGSWIRVRNASNTTSQPFRARIVRPGLVAVQLGNGAIGNGLP